MVHAAETDTDTGTDTKIEADPAADRDTARDTDRDTSLATSWCLFARGLEDDRVHRAGAAPHHSWPRSSER